MGIPRYAIIPKSCLLILNPTHTFHAGTTAKVAFLGLNLRCSPSPAGPDARFEARFEALAALAPRRLVPAPGQQSWRLPVLLAHGRQATRLKLLKIALQRFQFLTRLSKLSCSGQLLVIVEVLRGLCNQRVDLPGNRRRRGCCAR